MSNFDQGTGVPSDDALEQLLTQASPRPMPSQSDVAAVKHAVRAEWQHVSGRHQSRRRVLTFAIAATVLVGVFSIFSVFRAPVVEAVQVASIEKSFGSIYLLGEASELRETQELSSVLSGQTIVTGDKAGMALAWSSGGSMRMDENTRVEFTDDSSVYLESGRIYFDTDPSTLMTGITGGDAEGFVVRTEHGEVTHIGTQYMTRVKGDTLTVSVREGQVSVDGQYQDPVVASSGEQISLAGRQRPTVLSINRSGGSWGWVGRTSPAADVDGKSLHEFLLWACREMGLELRYEGRAEKVARQDAILRGTIDTQPADALRLRLASAALEWRIEEGVIYVSDSQ